MLGTAGFVVKEVRLIFGPLLVFGKKGGSRLSQATKGEGGWRLIARDLN